MCTLFGWLDYKGIVPYKIKGERLEMAILLDSYTGMRLGELLGLKWENVHIDPNGQSYIRKQDEALHKRT